ncbi:hypothetical protein ACFXKY_36645 [Streptomyces canus]|uniref:hypothetical protein n=1 Tax=Streptomyces canus TaxID=58343 RepID=UPI00369E7565
MSVSVSGEGVREPLASASGVGGRVQRVPASDAGPREGHVAAGSGVVVREPSVSVSGVGVREVSVSASGVSGREPVKGWDGSAPHQTGTALLGGRAVDRLAVPGAELDLTADVRRTPTLHTKIDSAEAADRQGARGAGAGRIP